MDVIVSRLFRNHAKNLNHVHKDSKYLVYVIITLRKNISEGDTVFYDRLNSSDLGSRSHVLKHLNGRTIFVQFEKRKHEVTLWSG